MIIYMKIVIEDLADDEEEHIIIKCRNMTPELSRLISQLKLQGALIAYDGTRIHRVFPADLFYIESVDNKIFLYGQKQVWESRQKLYELDELLCGSDFLRASKSSIINLRKVTSLSPALNGRLEATLTNGERVIISRQYVSDLKKKLGI